MHVEKTPEEEPEHTAKVEKEHSFMVEAKQEAKETHSPGSSGASFHAHCVALHSTSLQEVHGYTVA